ncbi:Uncharacterised protein [Serratia proteamaculans]|nr:Uncharacterised protein [Serratia proteamaculans]CAI2531250.1 Uncharacterised protein [Serratia proteamaculans]
MLPRISVLYPSPFKLQRCYLHSLTPVTYLSKRLGMSELAA